MAMITRGKFLKISAAALVGASLPGRIVRAQVAEPSFDAILSGARKENGLVIWSLFPSTPAVQQAVLNEFKKKFDLKTDWKWSPTFPPTAISKFAAESTAGRASADIAAANPDDVTPLLSDGIVEKFPWVQVFGKELPGIEAVVSEAPTGQENFILPLTDHVYALGWNPNIVKEGDLPQRWTDLTDSKWRGRFALNSAGLVPIDLLTVGMGVPAAKQYVNDLIRNSPVLKTGGPGVAQAIANGEVPIGVTVHLSSSALEKRGAPIRLKLLQDYFLSSRLSLFIPKNSPNPNTARLFVAWLVTEGMPLMSPEFIGRLRDPNSIPGQLFNEGVTRGGAKPISFSNTNQLADLGVVRSEIARLLGAAN